MGFVNLEDPVLPQKNSLQIGLKMNMEYVTNTFLMQKSHI